MSYEGSIWSGVKDGYIYGEEEVIDGEVFYKNLSLTKSGKSLLRISRLKLEDIDNAHGKNSLREWLIKPVLVAAITSVVTTPIGFYLGKAMSEQSTQQCAPDLEPLQK